MLKRQVFLSLLSLLIIAPVLQAETIEVPNKKIVSIVLTPEMAGKKINLYSMAPSVDHLSVGVTLDAPGGATGSVETLYVNRGEKTEVLASNAGGSKVPAILAQNGKITKSITVPQQGAATYQVSAATVPDPKCGCLTDEGIALLQLISQIGGVALSRDQICSQQPAQTSCDSVPGTGNPSGPGTGTSGNVPSDISGNTIVFAGAFIEFDRCANGKHGVVVRLDLSKVDPTVFNGGKIEAKIEFFKYGGGKSATIKPKSDGGKYPGAPLLLTEPVSYGGNSVRMVTWKGKKIARTTKPKVADIIGYGGKSYLRVILNGSLTGGRGTVEVINGVEGYSYCAKFVRSRQFFNGYKKLS